MNVCRCIDYYSEYRLALTLHLSYSTPNTVTLLLSVWMKEVQAHSITRI